MEAERRREEELRRRKINILFFLNYFKEEIKSIHVERIVR